MFLITSSFKTGWLCFGLACSVVPIYFCADPDTFKTIISNLFNTKYLDFLVYRSSSAVVDPTNILTPMPSTVLTTGVTTTTKKASRIPTNTTHFEFLKDENQKNRNALNELTQSRSDLYNQGRKNYKCSIAISDAHYSVFDNDCLIYKINKKVKKSSEILDNLELIRSRFEVDYDQMYVLKINGNSLKNTDFSDKNNKFTHDRNMVVEVLERDADVGTDENRMFYLNLTYTLTDENWWFGRTNMALVSGKSKATNVTATQNDEKICKNTFSNETDCILFSIGDTTNKATGTKTSNSNLYKLTLNPIKKVESSSELNDNDYYVVYYPNNRFGVPRSVSITRTNGFYKYTDSDETETAGRIIELEYQKMLMGSINLQDISKSQLFFIDLWPRS